MPGRDEQIQANINKARNTSVPIGQTESTSSAQPTDSTQPAQPSTPISSHKSLLGVNLDKLNTLESIQFQSGLKLGGQSGMGGEMYNSIAYIRYWKKKSDAETTQSTEQVVEDAESYTCLPSNLLWGPEALKLSFPFAEQTLGQSLTGLSSTQLSLPGSALSSFSLDPGFSLNLNGGSANPSVPQTTPATPGTLPSSTPSAGTTASPFSLQPTDYAVKSNFFKQCPKLNGTVASANPNGGFNGFIRRFLGLQYQNRVTYQGILSKEEGGGYGVNYERQEFDVEGTPGAKTSNLPGLGVWQFLFNPEEIDWEGGPEYGESETWGVMGDDNAGRPLFWKYMKNQRLMFSKVLLNGYVFGKRVDSLEKGLKDLFMEDTGDNPNGPPALEFVWGDRVFGPCLIKDVKIKEKNWDNGYLVNAEVSFTLEKIPKWVINDGEVDVARPSSQPIAPELFNPPPAPTPEPADDAGGGDDRQDRRNEGGTPSNAEIAKIKKCTLVARGKNCIPNLTRALRGFKPPGVQFKPQYLNYNPRQYLSEQQFQGLYQEAKRVQGILSTYRNSTAGIALNDYNRFLNKFTKDSGYSGLAPFGPSFTGSGECTVKYFQGKIKTLNEFYDKKLSGLNGEGSVDVTVASYLRAKEYLEKLNRDYYDPLIKCSRNLSGIYDSKYTGFTCGEVLKKAKDDKRVEEKDLRNCNK